MPIAKFALIFRSQIFPVLQYIICHLWLNCARNMSAILPFFTTMIVGIFNRRVGLKSETFFSDEIKFYQRSEKESLRAVLKSEESFSVVPDVASWPPYQSCSMYFCFIFGGIRLFFHASSIFFYFYVLSSVEVILSHVICLFIQALCVC